MLGKPQSLGKIGERLRKRGKERDDLDIVLKFIYLIWFESEKSDGISRELQRDINWLVFSNYWQLFRMMMPTHIFIFFIWGETSNQGSCAVRRFTLDCLCLQNFASGVIDACWLLATKGLPNRDE